MYSELRVLWVVFTVGGVLLWVHFGTDALDFHDALNSFVHVDVVQQHQVLERRAFRVTQGEF